MYQQKIYKKKKYCERYKNSDNMVENVTNISHMKNKSLFSIEKSITELEKMSFYNYKKAS